ARGDVRRLPARPAAGGRHRGRRRLERSQNVTSRSRETAIPSPRPRPSRHIDESRRTGVVKAARFRLGAFVALALVVMLAGAVHQAGAVSTSLVISQLYGGGGNAGA